MKSKRIILVASVAVVIVAALWYVRALTEWQSVTVQLDSELSVRVSRKSSHPFLAEYQRRVPVFRSGRRLAILSYPSDTGGGFPMQVRFYADATRRIVRVSDRLNDRLIDLRTGQFVPDETPPEGKEISSSVRDAALPPFTRSVEMGRDMEVVQ